MDNLTTYKNTNKTITVTLPPQLSGATDVKLYITDKENGGNYILSGHTGTTTQGTTTFEISASQNNVEEYVYWYNVVVKYQSKQYVISEGTYAVLPTLLKN
jgi:hypothetical protein